MELFAWQPGDVGFLTGLFSIIIIDLVLAGDNAIVIGMAARHLEPRTQKRVILWGTVGAVAIRALLTLIVLWLLKIPYLLLTGGLFLIWIAYRLLVGEKKHKHVDEAGSLFGAIRTILVADVVMGMDNVLAIAGASHGNFLLVVMGLLISVPIIVWGSTLIVRFIDRYPVLIYIGGGVLAYTAGKMITDEPVLEPYFEQNPVFKWGIVVLLTVGVVAAGYMRNRQQQPAR